MGWSCLGASGFIVSYLEQSWASSKHSLVLPQVGWYTEGKMLFWPLNDLQPH